MSNRQNIFNDAIFIEDIYNSGSNKSLYTS